MIKLFIGDNPKRAIVREALHHASLFACEYCFAKATSLVIRDEQVEKKKNDIQGQIDIIEQRLVALIDVEDRDEEEVETLTTIKSSLLNSLKNVSRSRKQVVWPSNSRNGEERTKEKIIEIVEMIEDRNNVTPDERKGIVGRSPLLELDNFDIVLDVVVEYLHCVCLGVVKRLVELTFNVGVTRTRNTKRKLTPPSVFNELIQKVKVVGEFSRRVRSLDFAVWKGQEFRNLCLFFFPIVINCIEPDAQERRLWLLLAYMIRGCVVPSNEFRQVNLSDINYCSKHFYTLYEQLFGARNCSYNTHEVGSHIVQMRHHGPLTKTSAFAFENFYGEVRHSFVPGTVSPLKQIFENTLIKRMISPHCCEPQVTYTTHETSLECNNLVYTYVHNTYNLYKINDLDDLDATCVKIETNEIHYPEAPELNWDKVGHFEFNGFSEEIVKIKLKSLSGKVIKIDDALLTCPINVLNEK